MYEYSNIWPVFTLKHTHERMSEYIRTNKFDPNEYPNKYSCPIYSNIWIFEYIRHTLFWTHLDGEHWLLGIDVCTVDTCLIAQLHSIAQYCTHRTSRMCHIAWYTLQMCHCAMYFSCFTLQGLTCTCMCKLHNTLLHRHTVDYLIPCTMHAHWWPLLCVHVCSQIRCHTLPHRMYTVEMSYASTQCVHNSGDVRHVFQQLTCHMLPHTVNIFQSAWLHTISNLYNPNVGSLIGQK